MWLVASSFAFCLHPRTQVFTRAGIKLALCLNPGTVSIRTCMLITFLKGIFLEVILRPLFINLQSIWEQDVWAEKFGIGLCSQGFWPTQILLPQGKKKKKTVLIKITAIVPAWWVFKLCITIPNLVLVTFSKFLTRGENKIVWNSSLGFGKGRNPVTTFFFFQWE